MGGSLRLDPARQTVLNDPEAEKLLGRTYRENHWAIPKGKV